MISAERDTIVVRPPDHLLWRGKRIPCALGIGGLRADKREGDRATPLGSFPLRCLLYRADRLDPPNTALSYEPINRNDGWCDAPHDPQYNRKVRLPYPASHEVLWRGDHLYDLIVPLGFNDDPVVPGRGSAIFIHVAAPDLGLTAGCVAVAVDDLLRILEHASPNTFLNVLSD